MSIKVQMFLYSWISISKDYDWIYTPLKENPDLNVILKDFFKTYTKIFSKTINRKLVVLKKADKLYIYKVENIRKDSSDSPCQCLFGFFPDLKQKDLFLNNLSFFVTIFYFLPENYLQISGEPNCNQHKEFEFNIKEILSRGLEENKEFQKFRLRLDTYLIEKLNWEEIIITEINGEYRIEMNNDKLNK